MKICMNDMLYGFSFGLDCVEHELLGVTSHHARRVAYLCVMIGEELGLSKEELLDLAAYAVLHDNALTEYLFEEYQRGNDEEVLQGHMHMARHCILGEQNLKEFPFEKNVPNVILYHHENADGSGPFKKRGEEIPLYAQCIRIADQVDARWALGKMNQEKEKKVIDYVKKNRGELFSDSCVEAFLEVAKSIDWEQIQGENIIESLRGCLPEVWKELEREEIYGISNLFAKIIDYKSHFTQQHSIGIAKKCEIMGKFYEFPQEKIGKLYFAGALHDVGKLAVDRDILEKPDKLSAQEYKHIQNHAYYTYYILNQVKGLEDVTSWASCHHEKLDGSGYPFGKKAEELGPEERLLACLDIYQALTEQRPYKDGFSHEKAMSIIQKMAEDNALDTKIVADINEVFGKNRAV